MRAAIGAVLEQHTQAFTMQRFPVSVELRRVHRLSEVGPVSVARPKDLNEREQRLRELAITHRLKIPYLRGLLDAMSALASGRVRR